MYVDKNDGAFISFLARIQMAVNSISEAIKKKYGSGDSHMQLILTSRGMEIHHLDKKFICRDGQVEEGRSQQIISGNH